jgi:hypothetical protein
MAVKKILSTGGQGFWEKVHIIKKALKGPDGFRHPPPVTWIILIIRIIRIMSTYFKRFF